MAGDLKWATLSAFMEVPTRSTKMVKLSPFPEMKHPAPESTDDPFAFRECK